MALPNPDLAILKGGEQSVEDKTINPPQNTQATPQDEEDIEDLLLDLCEKAEKEDAEIRYKPLQFYRRNELYMDNIQTIFWDAIARDYRSIDSVVDQLQEFGPSDDIKVINIYRAFAESIIAALSVAAPNLEFFPDDAEEPDDIQTAKAFSKIAEILEDHNDVKLLLIKIFTIHFNCGLVAAYNYFKSDAAYGVISKPIVQNKEVQLADVRCANCGSVEMSDVQMTQIPPTIKCNYCDQVEKPEVYTKIANIDETTGYENTPKGRVGIDIFGPTYVKVPIYARNQAGCGYLRLAFEDSVAKWKTVYSDYADDITTESGDTFLYDRWARVPIQYYGGSPNHICTGRFYWFRPWYYNTLETEDAQKLSTKYPNGCMVTVIGKSVVDHSAEKLDEVWTISEDPKANYIHATPQGDAIIPIQDAENDLYNLGLQSIEYGIPETFANPKTLNLAEYGKSKASPGMISPAKPPAPDKALSDGFFTLKTATLSNEYIDFDKSTFEKGQFISAALPSIWGGTQGTGSSRTAAEYDSSKSQALQRLQTTYETIASMYGKLIFKSCKMFVQNLREDEKHSKKVNGTFINIFVTKSELTGKVGHCKPEHTGQLPQSWAQQKDFVMSLMQLQDPSGTVLKILMDPNNTEMMKKITGMPDFYIPGENDRNKQYAEYYMLAQQEPIDDKTPSIPIDIDVDDHMVHMQVLKTILVSAIGLDLYQNSPLFYKNCIVHYRQHELAVQSKMQSFAGGTPPGVDPHSSTQTSQS